MANIFIDNKPYEVDERDHLLKVCLQLGFDLPYFCWHPSLGSVGACRQCAVRQYRDEEDRQGQIVMACMTPASDGTRISVQDQETRNFRARVIEWLMINHPHDCPVCEEGGECHLQDMTVMTGHTRRRFRGLKRTHRNQYLGPFISHEMNRCIACYRCTRFYRSYAGGDDLQAFASHHHVYFGRHEDGPLENEFAGNLVEVCPTGVFTDKTLGVHYVRKWDLQSAPSICHHCSLGCNTSPGERLGLLRRIQNRYHSAINGYFLCDRGRFGAGFVNREDRPRAPLLRYTGQAALAPVTRDEAMDQLRSWLRDARGVIGIGSPRASLEGNYALRRLVGADSFYTGLSASEQHQVELALNILQKTPARSLSLRETEDCDAVLVLGEDVTNTAPRLALSLRQAVRNAAFELADERNIPRWHTAAVNDKAQDLKSPLFVATPAATKLDDVARATCRAAPADIARLGFAVAHSLDENAPVVPDLDNDMRRLVRDIAQSLQDARRPLVVAGTSLGDETVLQAAANVATALSAAGKLCGIVLTLPECNSAGVTLLGGGDVDAALAKLTNGEADTLIVLENDLYRRASRKAVEAALARVRHLIVIDHSLHATAARADVVLPAGSFAEADGTLVNNEARAQRFFQVYVPEHGFQEGWRWCRDLFSLWRNEDLGWESLDGVISAIAAEHGDLAPVRDAAPGAGFRLAGQRFPRATPRYSGRTAMHAHKNVHEPRPPQDPDSPLAYTMEGYTGPRPAALYAYFWYPGWNANQQAITKFQDEVGGPLKGGDIGVHLIEAKGETRYYDTVPAAHRRNGTWLAVSLYHIFGSEPTSALAPAVAERVPEPYVAVHPDDLAALRVEGDELALTLSDARRRLRIRTDASLPRGVLGVPVGLAGLEDVRLPQAVAL